MSNMKKRMKTAKKNMERAVYPLKIQAIRSRAQAQRFYVYMPMPLAAALGICGGEDVQWELIDRSELRLVRTKTTPPKTKQNF